MCHIDQIIHRSVHGKITVFILKLNSVVSEASVVKDCLSYFVLFLPFICADRISFLFLQIIVKLVPIYSSALKNGVSYFPGHLQNAI
jgi:hypothetical protein